MNIQDLAKLLIFAGCFILSSCMEKQLPVNLSIELIDKGVKMNSFSTKESTVEVYLLLRRQLKENCLPRLSTQADSKYREQR